MTERTVLESISRRRLISASPQSNTYDAARMMAKAQCGSILIVDDKGSLIGIFTERDLMMRVVAQSLAPEKTLLAEVMTPNPRSVSPQTSVHDAVFLMKQCRIRHLPILSGTAVVGIFSLRDALPHEVTDADDLSENLDHQFSNVLA
jgi:signal-transduction protein with cAMP-binding, CBS, and nucleotidyltransferase domain